MASTDELFCAPAVSPGAQRAFPEKGRTGSAFL